MGAIVGGYKNGSIIALLFINPSTILKRIHLKLDGIITSLTLFKNDDEREEEDDDNKDDNQRTNDENKTLSLVATGGVGFAQYFQDIFEFKCYKTLGKLLEKSNLMDSVLCCMNYDMFKDGNNILIIGSYGQRVAFYV